MLKPCNVITILVPHINPTSHVLKSTSSTNKPSAHDPSDLSILILCNTEHNNHHPLPQKRNLTTITMTKDSTQTTNRHAPTPPTPNDTHPLTNHRSTPESQFWALTKHPKQVTSADITAVFDKLQPIAPEKLIGSRWRGYIFHSGHPAEKLLMEDLKFAGKDFVSLSEVNLMVFDGEGNWVKSEEWGNSRVGIVFLPDHRLDLCALVAVSFRTKGADFEDSCVKSSSERWFRPP